MTRPPLARSSLARRLTLTAALAAGLTAGGALAQAQTQAPVQAQIQAEGYAAAPAAVQDAGAPARGPVVAAAHPLAVEAGMRILEQGGSALDAAVAVQAVLGLAEPQSSGLGGGAFLMHYDAASRTVTAYDGRETAPSAATPELFYENGAPLPFMEAVLSGRSTGAPGAVRMLGLAHEAHGRLPWSALFGDAERLAREGFEVSPRLARVAGARERQAGTPDAIAYFSRPDGSPVQAGDRLTNPAYAATVRALAERGPDAFRQGEIPAAVVAAVGRDPRPGALTEADIANYEPLQRDPLCRPYRVWTICVPRPPSSGLALLQLLAMAEHTPDIQRGADSPEAWVAFGRLQRLMYADRDRYVGDADFVGVPLDGLLDPAYVARRAALLPEVNGPVEPGRPTGAPPMGPDATQEPAGTSHFVVVDAQGNAVSMTTTVESLFGSGRMAAGFFVNNQLTDFSLTPTDAQGRPAANAVAGGKRPRSSMSPVLILDRDGRLVGLVGSPGGNSILAYNAKAVIGVLDWGLSMQDALALPNLVVRGETVGADTEAFPPAIRDALAEAGMTLRPNASETSGLHGAIWRNGRWEAGADPRREGRAGVRIP